MKNKSKKERCIISEEERKKLIDEYIYEHGVTKCKSGHAKVTKQIHLKSKE